MKLTLDKVQKNTPYIIQAFTLEKGLLLKLNELGFVVKKALNLVHKGKSGAVIIKYNGIKYALGAKIAKNMVVSYT